MPRSSWEWTRRLRREPAKRSGFGPFVAIITVMEQLRRCEWCGQRFAVDRRPGRPPKYCRPSHRQRHYEARREAALRGLQPGDVLLTRDQYEAWSDQRYVLETLVEDIVADLTTLK